jgi:hypothetical protein
LKFIQIAENYPGTRKMRAPAGDSGQQGNRVKNPTFHLPAQVTDLSAKSMTYAGLGSLCDFGDMILIFLIQLIVDIFSVSYHFATINIPTF